jgi:Family of unknown function (DUF6152)
MKTLFAFLLMISGTASAHHGYAAFDTTTTVTFRGTVTDFHFVNPHCVVEFDVQDDRDNIQNWKGELSSSSHLAPRGWNAAALQAGDKITITGYRAKNGAPSLWVTKIVLPDGQELKLDAGN